MRMLPLERSPPQNAAQKFDYERRIFDINIGKANPEDLGPR